MSRNESTFPREIRARADAHTGHGERDAHRAQLTGHSAQGTGAINGGRNRCRQGRPTLWSLMAKRPGGGSRLHSPQLRALPQRRHPRAGARSEDGPTRRRRCSIAGSVASGLRSHRSAVRDRGRHPHLGPAGRPVAATDDTAPAERRRAWIHGGGSRQRDRAHRSRASSPASTSTRAP